LLHEGELRFEVFEIAADLDDDISIKDAVQHVKRCLEL
jgi:hypothetical protein